jgi:hypothetical protein
MDARPEKKPDTTQNLLALLDRLKTFAEEAAAAPDADEEHKWDLADNVELLCGSVATEIQIASDYERMVVWLTDVFPCLSAADRANFAKLGLGPFIPGGAVHLHCALSAAFAIGSLAAKHPALQAELAKLREKLDAPLKVRQDKAAEIKKLVWQMHDSGRTPQQIKGDLAAEEPPIERSLSWIYAMIAEGKTKS